MSEIKETELDHAGRVERLHLEFEQDASFQDVFVDNLGRLVVLKEDRWYSLKSVCRGNGHAAQKVVRIEKRYEGERETNLIIYLSSTEEGINAQVD